MNDVQKVVEYQTENHVLYYKVNMTPEPVAAHIEHVLAKRIIGKSVQPTVVSEELYAFSRDFGQ